MTQPYYAVINAAKTHRKRLRSIYFSSKDGWQTLGLLAKTRMQIYHLQDKYKANLDVWYSTVGLQLSNYYSENIEVLVQYSMGNYGDTLGHCNVSCQLSIK